jgi:predicted branched-subunit amino acid permease
MHVCGTLFTVDLSYAFTLTGFACRRNQIIMSSGHAKQDDTNHQQIRSARWQGFRVGSGVPALSLFLSMMGFAVIAREAGFDAVKTVSTTALVWGMPGQVAAVSLHITGASLWVAFTAVALANMRMVLMTISGMEMLGLRERKMGFVRKLGLMQLMAITTWIQLSHAAEEYPKKLLYYYYISMGVTIYISGLVGTGFGYFISDILPKNVLIAVLVMTPMYILLMVIRSRKLIHRYAGVCGGILCPLAFPVIGEWGILLGGIVGGTIAVVIKAKTNLMEPRRD